MECDMEHVGIEWCVLIMDCMSWTLTN